MTFNPALFDPTQLTLDIEPGIQAEAWRQSQAFATPTSRWNAHLNQLCLQTLLPWFREDDSQARPLPNAASLASFWELVNGTAIVHSQMRLVLIPTEAIDVDELRVPQEWIDISDWTADYYLSVQVEPDAGWVRVCGFASHQQVKRGSYDWRDRTYSIEAADLISDLNALWVSRQLHPAAPTREPVAPIDSLSSTQAENLIRRLESPDLLSPRTALPFSTWAGLIQHGGWRQRLLDRRRGLPEQRSVLQWLQSGVSAIAQQWGWESVELQAGAIGARGTQETDSTVGLSRRIAIDVAPQPLRERQPYELRILPVGNPADRIWRFELQNLTPGGRIPAGMTLRLLTEDLQTFEDCEDTATSPTDLLYIEVAVEPGEGLVWEVTPTAIDYDREILRF